MNYHVSYLNIGSPMSFFPYQAKASKASVLASTHVSTQTSYHRPSFAHMPTQTSRVAHTPMGTQTSCATHYPVGMQTSRVAREPLATQTSHLADDQPTLLAEPSFEGSVQSFSSTYSSASKNTESTINSSEMALENLRRETELLKRKLHDDMVMQEEEALTRRLQYEFKLDAKCDM